jgi:hypothetical protein
LYPPLDRFSLNNFWQGFFKIPPFGWDRATLYAIIVRVAVAGRNIGQRLKRAANALFI